MRIGELAARAGLRASVIRHYEAIGLLRRVPRVAGRRVYAEQDAARLRTILAATEAGLSLAAIKRLTPAFEAGHRQRARWEPLAKATMRELDARIRDLEAMRSRLHVALACGCGGDPEVCVLGRTR